MPTTTSATPAAEPPALQPTSLSMKKFRMDPAHVAELLFGKEAARDHTGALVHPSAARPVPGTASGAQAGSP